MRSCLELPHLVKLHPEVRNILPELQEVDFERNWALVWRGGTALRSQYWGTTWAQRKRFTCTSACFTPEHSAHHYSRVEFTPCIIVHGRESADRDVLFQTLTLSSRLHWKLQLLCLYLSAGNKPVTIVWPLSRVFAWTTGIDILGVIPGVSRNVCQPMKRMKP